MALWLGVDVGGTKKGFHVALLRGTVSTEPRGIGLEQVLEIADATSPALVFVDQIGHPAHFGDR